MFKRVAVSLFVIDIHRIGLHRCHNNNKNNNNKCAAVSIVLFSRQSRVGCLTNCYSWEIQILFCSDSEVDAFIIIIAIVCVCVYAKTAAALTAEKKRNPIVIQNSDVATSIHLIEKRNPTYPTLPRHPHPPQNNK